MPNTREKPVELISKWDVVNKLIQLENNYNFYKDVWDAQTLYRRICELEIGIGKTPPVAYNLSPTEPLTNCQQWIPVTERLPEIVAPYLVLSKAGNCSVQWFHIYGENFKGFFHAEEPGKITHWMPLPEPPKGE